MTDPWPSLLRRSRKQLVSRLNQEHGLEGFVEFHPAGPHGLPAAYLMHPRGHTLEVFLQGATVTRWLQEDGRDLLFVRSDAALEPGEPINSGIPLAFPQWRDGALPFNGFADKLQWEVVYTDLDGDFTNTMVGAEDFADGSAELALDENLAATLPRPLGLLDEADQWNEDEGEELMAGMEALFDEGEDAAAAAAAAAAPPKKKRGKKSKAELEAAAAAEAEATAVEAAAAAAAVEHAEAAVGSSSEDDDDATAAAAAASEDEDEETGGYGDGEGDVQVGVIEDPAPCIILKLTDSEETRAVWPHKFELYYKITLSETDDFPDPREGLPTGLFPWTGSDLPLSAEDDALMEAMDSEDEETAAEAARAVMEKAERAEDEALYNRPEPLPGHETTSGFRLITDDDGLINFDDGAPNDDDDSDDDDDDAAAASSSGRGRKKKAAEGEEEEGNDDEDEEVLLPAPDIPRELYEPPDTPMQIKLEWRVINKDPEGSPPFRFQLAALSHFRTRDQMRYGEFVRVLGLGGTQTFDYSEDPRKARLRSCMEDYITFNGPRRESVHISSFDADVMFCPGSRTYFDLKAREGLPDHVLWHPGALGLPGLDMEPRFFTQVGAGRIAVPKKLAPGEMWSGEFVIRHHNRYWNPPIFDRDGPQPMPQLLPQDDEADDREGDGEGAYVEGISQSQLGGGPDVPFMHE